MGVKVDYKNGIQVDNLDTIYITGGGYIRYPFKGISRDSALGWEEPVWGGDLTRSQDFALSNIEDVDFGLVARCEVAFKYMNEQDFYVLRKIAKQRVCMVDYYNVDLGTRVIQEMTFTDSELGKLYNYGFTIYGKTNVSIKLVATNRDKVGLIQSSFNVDFDANGGEINLDTSKYQNVAYTANVRLPQANVFKHNSKALLYLATNSDGTGGKYLPNQNITIYDNLKLYAIWG